MNKFVLIAAVLCVAGIMACEEGPQLITAVRYDFLVSGAGVELEADSKELSILPQCVFYNSNCDRRDERKVMMGVAVHTDLHRAEKAFEEQKEYSSLQGVIDEKIGDQCFTIGSNGIAFRRANVCITIRATSVRILDIARTLDKALLEKAPRGKLVPVPRFTVTTRKGKAGEPELIADIEVEENDLPLLPEPQNRLIGQAKSVFSVTVFNPERPLVFATRDHVVVEVPLPKLKEDAGTAEEGDKGTKK